MPRFRSKYGQLFHFPFNPEKIAGLLYNGYTVIPDEDSDETQLEWESRQIEGELRKLWGNQSFKSHDKTNITGYRTSEKRKAWDDKVFYDEKIDAPYKRVVPNPYINFGTPLIDELPEPEPSLEVRSKWDVLKQNASIKSILSKGGWRKGLV